MKVASEKTSLKILLSSGTLSREMLERTYREAELSGKSFLHTLLETGSITERQLLEIFSKATGYSVIDLKTTQADPAVMKRVPVKFASYYRFFPIRYEDGKLLVATSKILDIHTLDEMRFALGFDIGICFAPEQDIEEMLKRNYGLAADTVDKILAETPAEERAAGSAKTHEVEDIEKLASTPSVAHVVNQIILDAYRKRASDIHLEPLATGIRLRFRIDGVLREAPVPPELKDFFMPMLSRIKIMANLNVAEKRLPQDGKLRVKTQDETLDLRVSFIPTANGESVVIRILPGKNVFKLEQLGFEKKNLEMFEGLLGRPNGIIFVTGPTGSGKSTTLYAALNRLNSPDRKIITIEDPVEYELEGINQIQVIPEIGLTFSAGLRSMLRQDPDVMMVGEVRDLETADIAIRAALTGHLILSTIHTNDAASGVTRLLDIGVEPYLIASSVIAFIAQRLVRIICPKCKEENLDVPREILRLIEEELKVLPNGIHVYAGRGCDHCGGTGYRGREAVYEVLRVTEPVHKLIMARATAEAIKSMGISQGMRTLRQEAWQKVLAGITTPEEVLEVTEDEKTPGEEMGGQPEFKEAREIQENFLKSQGTIQDKAQAKPVEPLSQEKIMEEPVHPLQDKENPSNLPRASSGEGQDFVQLRKFPRIEKDLPVTYLPLTYRILDYKGQKALIQRTKNKLEAFQFEGRTENLSAGGLLFSTADQPMPQEKSHPDADLAYTTGDALEVGGMLDLKIQLPGNEPPVPCVAKILRVMRTPKTVENKSEMYYRVAVLFLAITSADRSRLEKFCKWQLDTNEAV